MRAEKCWRHVSRVAARRIALIAAAVLTLPSATAFAGFITIDQAGMDAIFSQSSFGSTPVDIRFNPPETIVDPNLLVIDDPSDLAALVALAPDPAPTVDAFFVDQIDVCGFEQEPTVNGSFAGCAQLPGHVFVEDSALAVPEAAPLMGHELGHNLNLQHNLFSQADLMWPFYPPGTELTEQEVALLLQSPLVQTDPTGQKFIAITPIAIVATSEPATFLLLGGSLGVLLIATAINRGRKPA